MKNRSLSRAADRSASRDYKREARCASSGWRRPPRASITRQWPVRTASLDVVAAIVAEVNNANLGFETEFAVRMQLDWAVMYTDPTMDPFTTINPPGVTVCNTRDENVAAISTPTGPLDPSNTTSGSPSARAAATAARGTSSVSAPRNRVRVSSTPASCREAPPASSCTRWRTNLARNTRSAATPGHAATPASSTSRAHSSRAAARRYRHTSTPALRTTSTHRSLERASTSTRTRSRR